MLTQFAEKIWRDRDRARASNQAAIGGQVFTMKKVFSLSLVFAAITLTGCARFIESNQWNTAKSINTLQSYRWYLGLHPSGQFSSEAQRSLTNCAHVVINHPNFLKSQASYYNIDGPVWVATIEFKEINGVGATIDTQQMWIPNDYRHYWGDSSSTTIFDSKTQKTVVLKIPPYGSASYTTWVNSPNHDLTGKFMHFQYAGRDDSGHPINVGVHFQLLE